MLFLCFLFPGLAFGVLYTPCILLHALLDGAPNPIELYLSKEKKIKSKSSKLMPYRPTNDQEWIA